MYFNLKGFAIQVNFDSHELIFTVYFNLQVSNDNKDKGYKNTSWKYKFHDLFSSQHFSI